MLILGSLNLYHVRPAFRTPRLFLPAEAGRGRYAKLLAELGVFFRLRQNISMDGF